jgi:short subunit dehydrogenase-like uncharacterized protein
MTTGTPRPSLRQPMTVVPSALVNGNRGTREDARMTAREFDVLLYGATGFVGRLTADYLARSAPADARIALAGRSADKLERLRAELGAPAEAWGVVVADAADAGATVALARRTTMVATTVGPYAAYGMPLARACAEAGTHYADLTGEVLFMRRTADELHDLAAGTGARIVHACGFDSIPSDLGVLVLRDRVARETADELTNTTFVLTGARGGLSGGTFASMKAMLAEVAADPAARRIVADAYSLSPARDKEPDVVNPGWPKESDLRGVVHDRDLGMWLAPFVMEAANSRVVRRSNALQDWAYGHRFRYREAMGFRGPAAVAKAAAVTGGLAMFAGAMMLGPTRGLVDRLLPEPGEGPSEKTRENGYFRIEIGTRTSTGARYTCKVEAQGDPGYAATAVMLGESALALALDGDRLPPRTGVLTPATGVGMTLVERLREQRFTFDAARD